MTLCLAGFVVQLGYEEQVTGRTKLEILVLHNHDESDASVDLLEDYPC